MAPANEARRALGMVTALCEAGAVFAVIIGWPFFSSASASPGAGSLPGGHRRRRRHAQGRALAA